MLEKKHYSNIKVTKLPQSEVEIEGEINAEHLSELKEKALSNVAQKIELPGFRKGRAPREIVMQKVGEMHVLEEAAEMALQESYPLILVDEKIDAIGLPHIHITKLALGNPLGFKIKTAIAPTVTLIDYRATAKKEMAKKDDLEVTDTEVSTVIEEIKKQKTKENKDGEEIKKELPELTDEFVKSLGKFSDVNDFKNKVRENIGFEKKVRAREKKRLTIIDEFIKHSSITLPPILIENELTKMLAQFTGEVEAMGIKWEDYLIRIKKTEEELKKEWHGTAEKRAKTQLILDNIAQKEKIEPEKDQIDKELEHLLKHYPEANPERAKIYVENSLRNEKVFVFLEEQN